MESRRNSGFSLVELIIVIAIMAILVAVLAPQYLRYVDRARYSRDIQTIEAVYSAIATTFANPEFGEHVDADIVVEFELPESYVDGEQRLNVISGDMRGAEKVINEVLAKESYLKEVELTCNNYIQAESVPQTEPNDLIDGTKPAIIIYKNGSVVEYIPDYGHSN